MAGGFDVGRAVGTGLGDRARALEFIGGFAAAWTRPLALEDGYGEDVLQSVEGHLGVRLTAALREAYLVLGKRTDLTARQDPLLPLDRLRVDEAGAVIVFRRENQACAEWGVAATDPWNPEDPPVYVREAGGRPWKPFTTRMSLACAEMVLSEVMLGAEFMSMCDLSGVPAAAAAESVYRRVALPEYPLWYDTASGNRLTTGRNQLTSAVTAQCHSGFQARLKSHARTNDLCTPTQPTVSPESANRNRRSVWSAT